MILLLWIIILCVPVNIGLQKPGPCSSLEGSVLVDNKCLKAFNIPLNWSAAMDFCSNTLYSGKLAEPVTLKEREAVNELVKDLGQSVWLGARVSIQDGSFVWTETNLSLSTTDDWWLEKQPNNENGGDDCVELLLYPALKINDAMCSNTNLPLCEIALISRNVVEDPCFPWKIAKFQNGKCLKMVTTALSWNISKSLCGSVSAVELKFKLIELLTEEQKDEAQVFGLEMNVSSYWTGGRADRNGGQLSYVWDTMADNSIPTNLWEYDQPNNQFGNQNCVCMMTSGLLNDKECNKTRAFVCERKSCTGTEWTSISDCLYINFTKKFMWEAQSVCLSTGGKLVELTTTKKFQALGNLLKGNKTEYYIGAGSLGGSFVWNVTNLPIRLNWWTGQVNSSYIGDCVAMYSTPGKLTDLPCSDVKPFVCQGEPRNPCDEILTDAMYTSKYCFKYYDMNMTWQAAQSYCLIKGSHLAELTTTKMDVSLRNYLNNLLNGTTSTLIWLGGTYNRLTNSFFWETNGDRVNKTNLNNLSGDGERENLVLKFSMLDIQWESRPESEPHGFLCQTAAVFGNAQSYVAVLPKLLHDGESHGYIQVTAGYSFVVYINFQAYINGIGNNKTIPLAPKDDVNFDLDQLLILPHADVTSSYVVIESNQPVTVILYITDLSMLHYSSTLLLPVSIYQTLAANSSYVVFTVFQEQPENMLSVVSMSRFETDVNFVCNNHDSPNHSFAIGRVYFTNLLSAQATLRAMYDVMTANLRANFNGAYLNSTQPVSVFIGSLGHKTVESTHDSTLDQLLPLPYADSEYFVFPSDMSSPSADRIKFIALYDWTHINIFNDSAIEHMVMKSAGDVVEIDYTAQDFLLVRGNASFYVLKINSIKTGSFEVSCISSILPSNAWRYDYDLVVNPMLLSFKFLIYLVVKTSLTDFVEINNTPRPSSLTCKEIKGAPYSGCYYLISTISKSYYHIGLAADKQSKFGAYVYATDSRSAICHPLGISDSLEPSKDANDKDLKKYLEKLAIEQDPPTKSTCGPDFTTSDNEKTTVQMTTGDTQTTSENLFSVTQTSDLTTSKLTNHATDLITQETNEPYVSTKDLSSISQSTATGRMTPSDVEMIDHVINTLTGHLYINPQNTSFYRRTKISVPDERVSATVAGTFGIAVIASVFSTICFGDVSYFVQFCITSLKRYFLNLFT